MTVRALRWSWHAAAWVAALLLVSCSAWASPQVLAVGDDGDVDLTRHLAYFQDRDCSATLADASQLQRAGRFTPLPDNALGFQRGCFWFHVRIVNGNSAEPRWLLVQRYALSDRLDVYTRYADGRVAHRAGGDTLPFATRSIRDRHPNFWLSLPDGEPVDLFVVVSSQSSMQVPLSLHTPGGFIEASREAQLAIGLYYGALLALLFYNLMLWISLRDASYFWYVLHIGAFGVLMLTINGLGFEYFWPRSTGFAQTAVPLTICFAQIAMQQFARSFLDLRQRWPRGDRVGLVMIGFFVLLAALSGALPYRVATPIATAAVFASIGWVAVSAVVVARGGYKPARLFLIAWSMFLLGTAMLAATAFGALPKNFMTEYSVQIGSALEMLLLSIALGYRYASLRNENERIVRDAKLRLEHDVEQRTAELRNALVQLGDAHARLRESSQRDALTGLHTRSHFREAFRPMLEDARANGEPLSMLMIDLDHFKHINDTLGHLAGDECLRWAAQRIGQALRPYPALLARFGGEEFIVALPGFDLASATNVAHEVLEHLREIPCRTQDHDVPMTASIGVHQVDPERDRRIEAALRLADEALYRAKDEGRNCVRASTPVTSAQPRVTAAPD